MNESADYCNMDEDSCLIPFQGFKFLHGDLDILVDRVIKDSVSRPMPYHFVNAYSMAKSVTEPNLRPVLCKVALVCDSKPMARVLRLGCKFISQVRGIDFMRLFLAKDTQNTHFFLGTTEATLNEVIKAAASRNPNLRIAGWYAPPFRLLAEESLNDWILKIRTAKADIVWVGLGTPKQNYVVDRLSSELSLTTFAVGAAFDFMAGTVTEAPNWTRKLYLEWAWRFIQEPRRLFMRYALGNLIFMVLIVKHLFFLLRLQMRRK